MRVVGQPEEGARRGPEGLYVTIGSFDGFHVGHQAVIRELVSASRDGGRAVAVTFDPHPATVVGGGAAPAMLSPGEEKIELLAGTGLAELVIVPFTRETASSDARTFLGRIGVGPGSHLVLGYDFHMGRGRATDLARLSMLGREAGFGLDVVAPVLWEGAPVSSTRVRESLMSSDPESAERMLGRPYRLRGRVIRGSGIGRAMGAPTANLSLPPAKLLPGDGVYMVSVRSMSGRPGLLYVGRRPTMGPGERRVEVHVLDLEGDLYGEALDVELAGFVREDRAFSSPEELSRQMAADVERARRWAG